MASRLYEKCEMCGNKDSCDNKMMEACAYFPLMNDGGMVSSNGAMASMLIPRDYREIKISPDTMITIDLEAIKKEIANSICPIGLQFGA